MSTAERLPEPSNALGMDGIEFIEYETTKPQEFGGLLQQMGFAMIARHRSREVTLFRQGAMNIVLNAHAAWLCGQGRVDAADGEPGPTYRTITNRSENGPE